jgi:hypothetical protein
VKSPTHSGWYAALPARGRGARGRVVLATLGADGYMLARIEGEPEGPRVLSDPKFAGMDFVGPFESPEVALEQVLRSPDTET